MDGMHTYCNLRKMSRRILSPKVGIEGLKGLNGFGLLTFSMVRSGYLHTLPRSRLEGVLHEGLLAGGEAEPDGKQRGGPGAAPGPPHRPAAPRAPSPQPDAHAAQGGGRGGVLSEHGAQTRPEIEIRYVFYCPPV